MSKKKPKLTKKPNLLPRAKRVNPLLGYVPFVADPDGKALRRAAMTVMFGVFGGPIIDAFLSSRQPGTDDEEPAGDIPLACPR